jgi:hypothetical protein
MLLIIDLIKGNNVIQQYLTFFIGKVVDAQGMLCTLGDACDVSW